MRSATGEELSVADAPTRRCVEFTAELARGGTGLIVAGSAYVSPEGRYDARETGIDRDALIAPLSRMCDAVHHAGGLLSAQLSYSGYAEPAASAAENTGTGGRRRPPTSQRAAPPPSR